MAIWQIRATLPIEGQLLQRVIFLKDTLYMVGTNHLMLMDYIGTKQSEKLIYGWEFADSYVDKNENTRILFIPGGEDARSKEYQQCALCGAGGERFIRANAFFYHQSKPGQG